ncbi:MAG: 2-C-methyl-D-erythritol 4-phosphate cytidylyltransferase [candidate division WOR-3 bacterium]
MFKGKKIYAVILAAGSSERFRGDIPKQFVKIAGKMIVEHTIEVFERHYLIDEIYLVVNPSYRNLVEELVIKNTYRKVVKILDGGKTRQESSKIAVKAIENSNSFVLIHDAVRPFVSSRIITEVIEKLEDYDAVDVAITSVDTIIRVKDELILEIPDRQELMLGQTPQGFKTQVIKTAYEIFEKNPIKVTDDCGLIVKYNLGKVYVVQGERFNIKITYPEDLYYADKIFQVRSIEVTKSHEISLSELKDKILVVFGGARGIGKEICELARSYGAVVYSFSRKNGCDISKPENVQRVLREVHQIEGRINYVVNTAALLKVGLLESMSYDVIMPQVLTNYFGAITVAKESFPYLRETKGTLLLFSSSSYTRGRGLYSIYSSTKAAIVNFAQALSEEWAPFGCKVNVINPERTNTEMRRENFGPEDPSTLLDPRKVAEVSLMVLLLDFTGQVIDVRKK